MQANMVVGTFAAYAITRDPQLGSIISKKGPVAANCHDHLFDHALLVCDSSGLCR